MCDKQKIWTPDGYIEDKEDIPRGLYRTDLTKAYDEERTVEFIGTTQEPAKIARAVLAGKPPNLMGSKIHDNRYGSVYHAPLLDIDVPHRIKRSSTQGHRHILIDSYVPEKQYINAMKNLQEIGIVQEGFTNQLERFGQTFIRWNTTKGEEETT